ncbi:MAG TPA: SRPBCC family protein [Streptosporangiaceae bacterium]|nr:SRPBCC family protein [Streptosporangiaceae bacterium]
MSGTDTGDAGGMRAREGFGVLERGDTEVTLRFVRRLPHPPEKVWRALTEPAHLAAWFPTTIEGELAAGSRLRFSFMQAQVPSFDGTMLAFDPPALMELIWGDERLRFELTPDGAGTLLTFTASFAEVDRAARDGAGWHVCLDLLGHDLGDAVAPWNQGDRWRAVHAEYVARFGPEAATVGPPAGLEPGKQTSGDSRLS